jgi:DHA3 family macrolide efflux protein-like MFS transporter
MGKSNTLRTFYILIVTQTLSLIGSRMTGLAIGIKVFQDTEQATPLALAAFFGTLPRIVSASIAGVLADRWDRRYVMMISDAGQAVGTLVLLVTFATGTFELWHLYVVSLIQSVFGVFQEPAFQASVTMLVPDEHRDRANVVQQLTGPASSIVAPVLAGLLFVVIGAVGVMTIDLVTFLIAVAVVLVVHIPRPEQTAEGKAMQQASVWKESLVGLRFLRGRRALLISVLYVSLVNFLIVGAMVLSTPYILSLTRSEAAVGTLQAAFSAGSLVGGIVMSIWGGTRPRIHTIMPGIAAVGLGLAAYGMARNPILLGAALCVMAFPLPMINASFMSIMQIKTPPDVQGRVFATLGQISMFLMPISTLLAGPLADRVFEPAVGGSAWAVVEPVLGTHSGAGMGLIMLISGSLIALVTLAVYTLPMIRQMEAILPDYTPVAVEVPGTSDGERSSSAEPAAVL